jgi:2-polyprenyl-3-methyl-5-hydroxy-6-metoxy-1,4-benzoquinol methylase
MHTEEAKTAGRQAADAIKNAVGSLAGLDVLDFASGPGNVSIHLAPHVRSIMGLDISQSFVEDYTVAASTLGFQGKMSAKCIDITEKPDELGQIKFDLIFCVAAYHHFPSPSDMTVALSKFLKPSGRLIIMDGFASPEDPHGQLWGSGNQVFEGADLEQASHAVPHKHGFTPDEVKNFVTGAGLEFVSYDRSYDFKFAGRELPMFISVARKPSSE